MFELDNRAPHWELETVLGRDGCIFLEDAEEKCPSSWLDAVICCWYCIKISVQRGKKKSGVMYQKRSPKNDTNNLFQVFPAGFLKKCID